MGVVTINNHGNVDYDGIGLKGHDNLQYPMLRSSSDVNVLPG